MKNIQYYKNLQGPIIGVSKKPVIEQDGLYFRDLNGDGKLTVYKDWRRPPMERAEALTKELSVDEKIGMLFVNSWKMGIFQEDKTKVDETGLLNEEIVEQDESIFNVEKTYGTTYTVEKMKIRHFILRQNPSPRELTEWINQLNILAEESEHAIPVMVISNSRNENGEIVFGMNDAAGVFPAWPGTMGIAAAVKGSGLGLIDKFANCIRRDWNAVGMRKGYMYMADVMTDPRWQRTYGTFGEDPDLICDILDRLIPGVQGCEDGLAEDGVAMTIKHFPGGGARENGFDPHYAQGQWNIYQTENSLQKYHIPGFEKAIEKKASSIMPYYAKPAKEKSKKQYDMKGNVLEMQPLGFAFNHVFLQELLREQLGFQGYINSDSGITNKMAWGVEMLDVPSRIALAINTGVDIISGSMDVESAKEAYRRGVTDYYGTNPIPEGFLPEQLVLTEEALNHAVTRTLREKFELGMFENPYRQPKESEKVVSNEADWEEAYDVHLKSIVLLKNKDLTLPYKKEENENRNVYIQCFRKDGQDAAKETEALQKTVSEKYGLNVVTNYQDANDAILFVSPSSGEYFNATKGYLELDICENKQAITVDEAGCPTKEYHAETTLYQVDKIKEISDYIHEKGGHIIASINFTLAWEVGNVEPYVDALLAGFDTYYEAVLDIITEKAVPTGRMPITLPKDDTVLAVDKNGTCISPNDVPGYDKDLCIPESMKDENGKAYAYRDSEGNYYELDFGLVYVNS